MVERIASAPTLDAVFGSLSDPIRRDILARVSTSELSVTEIAEPYEVSLAAISKHLKVLERSGLVSKTRAGKQQLVRAEPEALDAAITQLEIYKQQFVARVDRLADYLEKEQDDG
jgi:DNA-binding transcriptional ArsR family regulator